MSINKKKYEDYVSIPDNESYEFQEPIKLSFDELGEYLNYRKISSIIGAHTTKKDSYLYLLLIENAYDLYKDEYMNYIKIGITDDDPINRFHNIYTNYYPMGNIKILMLIKMSKPKSYETEIKKLCIDLNLKNIYTKKNGADNSKSIECYPYNNTMKHILNSYLLENKKEFLSYYFNDNNDFFKTINNYIIDHKIDISENEIKNLKIINEKEIKEYKCNLKDYELSLKKNNDDYLYNKKNNKNIINNNQIKECPKEINKDIEKNYCAIYFNDSVDNIYGWYYGKIKFFRNRIIGKSPNRYNIIIEIFTKENNFETKIIASSENYGIENCWVLLKDNMSI